MTRALRVPGRPHSRPGTRPFALLILVATALRASVAGSRDHPRGRSRVRGSSPTS